MQSTQITLRNIRRSPSLSARIRELSERMEGHHPGILNVRVAVSHDTLRPVKGGTYCVVVRVRVPGRELVTTHEHDADVYVAVRDAFNAMRRELEQAAQSARAAARRKAAQEAQG
jgi:ribosome-associated translation inhibitor RaiA